LEKGVPDSTFQLLSGEAVQGIPLPADSASSLGIFNYGTSIKFSLVGKQIQATIPKTKVRSAISVGSSLFTLRWSGTESLAGPAAVIVVNGVSTSIRLHYGQVQLRAVAVRGVGYRIEISDSMRLHDEYLYGISEVSSSWPIAALQSQVIASRTYALSRMGRVRRECDCQIYNSKYDQSYIGYAKEAEPRYGKLWKAAVDQTAADPATGVAIFYQGKPINVYFFSSSGGMTQRSQDVWGTAFPYLTNVPDPWSLDPIFNPNYSHWSRTVTQEVMAAAFGLPDVIRYEVKARSASNSVISVIGYSVTGTSKVLSVGDFKVRVKLPSSWFDSPTPSFTSTPSPQPTSSS
jgi:stage II sporulation protein D